MTTLLRFVNNHGSRNFWLGGSKLWFRKDCWTILWQIASLPHPLDLLIPVVLACYIPWPLPVYLNSTHKGWIIVNQLRKQRETRFSICECRSLLAQEILLWEQRQTDHRRTQKQLHFWVSLEFSFVAKWNAHFILQVSQFKSVRISVSNKLVQGPIVGGGWTPRTLPLDPLLRRIACNDGWSFL